MNTIRTIESATLLSIASLCAAAVCCIVFQSAATAAVSIPAKIAANSMNQTAIVQLAPVVIVGKRLTAAQKAAGNL